MDDEEKEGIGRMVGMGVGIGSGTKLGGIVIPIPLVGPFVGGVLGGALGSELGRRTGRALIDGSLAFVHTLLDEGPATHDRLPVLAAVPDRVLELDPVLALEATDDPPAPAGD